MYRIPTHPSVFGSGESIEFFGYRREAGEIIAHRMVYIDNMAENVVRAEELYRVLPVYAGESICTI